MPKINFPNNPIIYIVLAIVAFIIGYFANVILNNHNLENCLESGQFYSECVIP